ncbi:hypothetical protein N9E97_00520 [Planktomarina sp.]|nr:hypothetical protein [Planktomarina sp.]
MKKMLLNVVYIGVGLIAGSIWSNSPNGAALAQFAPPGAQSGDALWHLPKFGNDGWFLHASNGRVRACNVNNVSVVGAKPGPRCSGWE